MMKSKSELIEGQTKLYQENLKKINSEISELKDKIGILRDRQYKTEQKIIQNERILDQLAFSRFHKKITSSLK